MAVTVYASEDALKTGIGATSVITYDSEAALQAANPQSGDVVLAKGAKYTHVVGGTYIQLVAKGGKFTAIT